jgi:hypothetical protein
MGNGCAFGWAMGPELDRDKKKNKPDNSSRNQRKQRFVWLLSPISTSPERTRYKMIKRKKEDFIIKQQSKLLILHLLAVEPILRFHPSPFPQYQ